eukprot:COSAG05_NODE_2334_length_3218_cov_5.193331_1_plen_436_part_00
MSVPPRLTLDGLPSVEPPAPETPPAIDAARTLSRGGSSPGAQRATRSPQYRMRSPPHAPLRSPAARSPAGRRASTGAQRPLAQKPPPAPQANGGGSGSHTSSRDPDHELQKLSRENAKLRRRLEAQRGGGRRGAAASDAAVDAAVSQSHETDMLIEELSKEIVELTDENKHLHRLQEELSLEVVTLSQELEQLQEQLDRRRAGEQQAALRELLRRFDGQGKADAEELLLQISSLTAQLVAAERAQGQIEQQLARVQREHDADMSARDEKITELETLLTMATDEIARVARARSTQRRSRSRPKPRHPSHQSRPGEDAVDDDYWSSGRDDIESGSDGTVSENFSESGDSSASSTWGRSWVRDSNSSPAQSFLAGMPNFCGPRAVSMMHFAGRYWWPVGWCRTVHIDALRKAKADEWWKHEWWWRFVAFVRWLLLRIR